MINPLNCRCVREACADHLLQLVKGNDCLSKEGKGRLVAMAAERLSDLDGGVAAKWLQLLCLLAREAAPAQQVDVLAFGGAFGERSSYD